jgi:hypothetical protein
LHGDRRELLDVARNTWWLLRHLFVLHLLSPFYSLCGVYGRSLTDGFVCLWTESWMAILLNVNNFLYNHKCQVTQLYNYQLNHLIVVPCVEWWEEDWFHHFATKPS